MSTTLTAVRRGATGEDAGVISTDDAAMEDTGVISTDDAATEGTGVINTDDAATEDTGVINTDFAMPEDTFIFDDTNGPETLYHFGPAFQEWYDRLCAAA